MASFVTRLLLFVKTGQGWRTDYQLPEAERGQALFTGQGGSSGASGSGPRSSEWTYNVEMTQPEKLSGPVPQYTREALDNGVEGTFIARCILNREGQVRDCRVTQSLPFMEESVLQALYASRYKPATVQGKPVDLTYTFTVKLVLPPSLRKDKKPKD